MNKKYFKSLFCLIIVFAFSYNVKADLNCSSAPKHTVKETSVGDPAKFDTQALVCSWVDGGLGSMGKGDFANGGWKFGNSFYDSGIDFANEIVSGEVGWISASNDGKDVSSGSTAVSGKRCSSPNKKFITKVTATRAGCNPCYYEGCDSTKDLCSCPIEETTCTQQKESKEGCDYLTCVPAENGCPGGYSTSLTCELFCPTASCVMTEQTIGACTPSFTADGYRAWCVNPSQKFGKNYNEDPTFDPSKCANSYATTDCGYANILIEAEHYRQNNIKINGRSLDDKIIDYPPRAFLQPTETTEKIWRNQKQIYGSL